jgi:signal transduction histidine kinase
MTDLREANERLVIAALTAHELRDLAEEAHGQQIKFMAMVAHELRNPLTPIKLAAGMLGLVNSDAGRIGKLQGIIEDQVRHISRLVEDLLDGSRISTGKLRLQLSSLNLIEILQTTIDICKARATEQSQNISVELPASDVYVSGDRIRLTQVFSNLLDNASKYTPAGGHITLGLNVVAGHAVVTVCDDGVGITPEMLPHIFDLFVQEPRALALNSGLGIGLAVVRELVDAHGGTVVAESAGRNRGCHFTVTLPVMEDPAPDTAVAAPDHARGAK